MRADADVFNLLSSSKHAICPVLEHQIIDLLQSLSPQTILPLRVAEVLPGCKLTIVVVRDQANVARCLRHELRCLFFYAFRAVSGGACVFHEPFACPLL